MSFFPRWRTTLWSASGILLGLGTSLGLLADPVLLESANITIKFRKRSHIESEVTWSMVSRTWYMTLSHKTPGNGRFYHNLALATQSSTITQLSLHAKSLCTSIPSQEARQAVILLCDNELSPRRPKPTQPKTETSFVRAHGVLLMNDDPEVFNCYVDQFISLLDFHISTKHEDWIQQGQVELQARIVSMQI